MKSTRQRQLMLILAVLILADAAAAQNFGGGSAPTFTTGLPPGIDRVLSMVVNAARVFGMAGGLVHMVRNGMSWQAGDRDALEMGKGVIIGFIIIGASYGIADIILDTVS